MLQKSSNNENIKSDRGIPLSLVLAIPFVLQIFAAVGLTGYFSLRNGQQAVNDLATQLMNKTNRLEQACRQLRQWQLQLSQAANLKISVNLASQQIENPHLSEQIERILAVTGLDGSGLQLEITETMLLSHTEATINMLLKIKSKNIELSIDDFGKGYSSLSYLHQFPIDRLKIDSYFISQINSNSENGEIVSTINTLAHNLGMGAIAEGVETAEQYAQLKALGCDFGQGYFFAKPLDCRAAEALILSNPQW